MQGLRKFWKKFSKNLIYAFKSVLGNEKRHTHTEIGNVRYKKGNCMRNLSKY